MILLLIMNIILLMLCLATAIYACYEAYKKIKMGFTEGRLFMLLAMVVYALVYLVALVLRIPGDVDRYAERQAIREILDMGYDPSVIYAAEAAVALLTVFVNVGIGIIIKKTNHPIIYSIALVCGLLGLIGCGLYYVDGVLPLTGFFLGCCGLMAHFAILLDLTYKEFCVLGNIYLQAFICLMASTAPLLFCIRKKIGGHRCFGLSLINFMLHLVCFFVISVHYLMPLEQSFDLCYRELNQFAVENGTTYVMANIVFFVTEFLADLLWNACIYRIVTWKV